FFFPGTAGPEQDQMPSTRREPGSDADGREADAAQHRRAQLSNADASDASESSGGPMTPFEAEDGALEEATLLAPSTYSPLHAEGVDAPELPRATRAWRDAARSFVRRLHL